MNPGVARVLVRLDHWVLRAAPSCGIAAWVIFLVLLLSQAIGCQTPAHAAVRMPLHWTAPDTAAHAGGAATRYEAQVRAADGSTTSLKLYADSLSTSSPPIAAPGARQAAWALVSESWRSGGTLIRVRPCNAGGCSAWSNPTVILAGIPDTLWVLQRPDKGPGQLPPRDTVWIKRAKGRVWWSLQPGDTTSAASIVHVETLQQALRARLCALYGYWCLRGTRQVCP